MGGEGVEIRGKERRRGDERGEEKRARTGGSSREGTETHVEWLRVL
jgi:hypothetical protein